MPEGRSRQLNDDLRYEMEERYTSRPVHRERSSFTLLGIIVLGVMLGTLAADAARLIAANAWANYQLKRMNAELNRAAEQQRLENQAKAQALSQFQLQRQQQLEYERKLNSDKCRFWTTTHQANPSNKTQAGIAQHCP